jgi:hypothetical protein
MQPKPESKGEQASPHEIFGLGVFAADLRHAVAALRRVENVRHLDSLV